MQLSQLKLQMPVINLYFKGINNSQIIIDRYWLVFLIPKSILYGTNDVINNRLKGHIAHLYSHQIRITVSKSKYLDH